MFGIEKASRHVCDDNQKPRGVYIGERWGRSFFRKETEGEIEEKIYFTDERKGRVRIRGVCIKERERWRARI